MKIFLHVILSWLNALAITPQTVGNDSIFRAIKQENLSYISGYLNHDNINIPHGQDSIPLLHVASRLNKTKVFELLLEEGASTGIIYQGEPLIISTAKTGNRKLVKLLLRHGAEVNASDEQGNTALMHAVLNKDLKMIKLLVREGANIEQENKNNVNSRELSLAKGTMEITKFLKTAFERRLPPYIDGPHLEWNKNFTRVKVSYLVHDSVKQITKKISTRFPVENGPFEFKGFAGDTNSYMISKDVASIPTKLDTSRKIFVMGDVHGDYQNLVLFLRKMNIIDSNDNWNWGKNYLLFIGDIFDRGDKVTECLWLIYKLEKQAKNAGGEVIFLLGNHEFMVMENDLRYIAEKYYYLSNKLRLEYGALFQPHMELGRWLRSKPVMARAGKILFVHGGLSPEILKYQLQLEEINALVNSYLLEGQSEMPDTLDLLVGYLGPLWYRGMIDDNRFFEKMKLGDLNKVLEHFNAEKIIVGHTNVPSVSFYYNGRVIAIDIPFYRTGDKTIMQALVISGEKIQVVGYNDNKINFD